MDESANQPAEPDPDGQPNPDAPAPDASAKDISADRRRFFSQLLALGLDGVEHVGRNMGKRFTDAIASANLSETEPAPLVTGPDPAPDAIGRGEDGAGDGDEQDYLDLEALAEREPDGDADDEFFDRAEADPTYE